MGIKDEPETPEDWTKEGARFALGRIVATPGAIEAMKENKVSPARFLSRHIRGDWGDSVVPKFRRHSVIIAAPLAL